MAPRPVLAAAAQQQKMIESQQRQLDFLARLAGVEPQMAALRHTADANNPADPVPDPGAQAPSESTDQARVPGAYDDPRAPGMTPGSTTGVPAAATDVPMQPGASLPTAPYNQLVDVQAPVAGTEGTTGAPEFGNQAGQDGVTRIETDVRALGIGEPGDQMNPTTAFPWNISPDNGNGVAPADGEMAQGSGARMAACMRLAQLRIRAGLDRGDEFEVSARLEANAALTGSLIVHEIGLLSRLGATASAAPRRPDLVPRMASAAPRPVVPSLAEPPRMHAYPADDELEISDLF